MRDEFALIQRYFRPLITQDVYHGRDDAACLKDNQRYRVISTDGLASGVHFLLTIHLRQLPAKPYGLIYPILLRWGQCRKPILLS